MVSTCINFIIDLSVSALFFGLAANEITENDLLLSLIEHFLQKHNFPKLRRLLLYENRQIKTQLCRKQLLKADITCHTATPNIVRWQRAIVKAFIAVFLPILFAIKAFTGYNPSHNCLTICCWELVRYNGCKKGAFFSALKKHTYQEGMLLP